MKLQAITLDETVGLCQQLEEQQENEEDDIVEQVLIDKEKMKCLVEESCYISYESSLDRLAKMSPPSRCSVPRCKAEVHLLKKPRGTGLRLLWVCQLYYILSLSNAGKIFALPIFNALFYDSY